MNTTGSESDQQQERTFPSGSVPEGAGTRESNQRADSGTLRVARVLEIMRNYSLVAVSALAFVLSIGPAQAHTKKAIWGPELMPDGSSALLIYRALGVRYLELPELVGGRAVASGPSD